MVTSRDEIVNYLNTKLSIPEIQDSSNNGLQVEGSESVDKVGLAVDACMEVYKKAVEAGCDMLVVHHGLIWDGIKYVTGRNFSHVKFLIDNKLNLFAAHLPLDMHAELGNNVELARLLKLKSTKPFGDYKGVDLGFMGTLPKPISAEEISEILQAKLGGTSVILPFGKDVNSSVGIVSGGAPESLKEATEKGIDCYVTGEGNYMCYHLAEEAGINVVFLGHYHSEKLGVLALGRELNKKFGVETVFIDEPSIVNHF